MKKLLFWLGTLFIPYITVFVVWAKKMFGKTGRIVYTAWAVIALIIAIVSVSNGNHQTSSAPATSSSTATTTSASTSTPSSTSKSDSSSSTKGSTTKKAPPPAKWHTVKTWKGDAVANTQPFTVGDNWRIVWTSKPGKAGAANFVVNVMKPGINSPLDMVGNVVGKGDDTSSEHGAGTYYLNIQADENYTINVETKVSSVPKQPHYSWHTVYSTSGSSMKTTSSFKVKAPWRVEWTSKPGSIGSANFTADIYSKSSSTVPAGSFANVIGKDSGVDYQYKSGTFYIKILADEGYSFKVQQGK